MRRQYWSIASVVFAGAIATFGAVAYAQAPEKPHPLILARDEGDLVGSHYIKADPQTGSMRLGVGLQHLKGRQGIPMHRHDREDEILFIHSGSGVGTVGDQRKNISAGTTLYIPQGTWHGIDSQSDEMEILWVASPPHFAENLREIGAKVSRGGNMSSGELDDIARKHGFRDSRQFFLPRLASIAATLAFAAVFVTLIGRDHRFRAIAHYGLGATLATIVTLLVIGAGYLPPTVLALATLIIAVAVVIGGLGGIGIRSLAYRLTSHSG
jgi:quercetin dioxygenase-like cupin family protein